MFGVPVKTPKKSRMTKNPALNPMPAVPTRATANLAHGFSVTIFPFLM